MNNNNSSRTRKHSRPVSTTERVFFAFEQVYGVAINQFVLEGSGELNPEHWQQAVAAASEANPGCRLVWRGRLGWSRLVDTGVSPRVRVIPDSNWSGNNPDNADFLCDPLSMRDGPTSEVLLLPGTPSRVIIRTHHVIMDAGGTLLWANDIFNALNGRPLVGSQLGITDIELARSLESSPPQQWQRIYPAPTGESELDEDTTTWRRISIEGSYSMLLPKIALYVAQRARTSPDEKIHINIPVDMRKRAEVENNIGNLLGYIHILVEADSTPESIAQQIRDKLEVREYAALNPGTSIALYLPVRLIAGAIRKTGVKMREDSRYAGSAILTNPGRLDLAAFTAPDFQPSTGFFVPPGSGLSPAIVAITGHERGIELVVAMPTGLASHGRIDEFLQGAEVFLKEFDDSKNNA